MGHALSLQMPSLLLHSLLVLSAPWLLYSQMASADHRPSVRAPHPPTSSRPFSTFIKVQVKWLQHHWNSVFGQRTLCSFHCREDSVSLMTKRNCKVGFSYFSFSAKTHKVFTLKMLTVLQWLCSQMEICDGGPNCKEAKERTEMKCCFGKCVPVTWELGVDSHLKAPFTIVCVCVNAFSVCMRKSTVFCFDGTSYMTHRQETWERHGSSHANLCRSALRFFFFN